MTPVKILWHKLTPDATIPTKRAEDAGFDIYTTETDVLLQPHEKHLFKTGLTYWIDKEHWLMGADRGSTGSRGLHIHCGICDQGYRGEIFVCICNDNDFPVHFSSSAASISMKDHVLEYPTTKAIAQLIPMSLLPVESAEAGAEWEELCHDSERGSTKLGASGK